LTLENELRRALANKEICVHYQPEFDLATNSVIRFEALARWTHSNLGVISPASFIPVAEECGLIVPLGTHILELACREALTWQENLRPPLFKSPSTCRAFNSHASRLSGTLSKFLTAPDFIRAFFNGIDGIFHVD
jgi:EAL domain-containing protein (putative c-di-GMP-specific phosphodiesterase class I)